GGHEAAVLEVDADLAAVPGFSEALESMGSELDRLSSAHVVATHSVGRSPDGHLVVVTEAVVARVSVEELLQWTAPRGLPQGIAAGIGKQLIRGLAAAHRAGVVHGAVHPRSVVVDRAGVVKLDDFAVGQALASAIAY